MIRKIIHIDQEKCNGCGACAQACHEGAIGMVNGKATLLRDDYCDGLGDCLPACPTGAITFVEREAAAYDHQAVLEHQKQRQQPHPHARGCPGHQLRQFHRAPEAPAAAPAPTASQLGQWPCQIKLVPTNAPYFDGAKLLIAADCTAFAYAQMHQEFMRGKRYRGADGGPLLRRAGDGRQKGPPAERQVHPLAGGHHLGGRPEAGLTRSPAQPTFYE